MTDSGQHPTTRFGCGTDGRFLSGKLHENWKDSLPPEEVGKKYGSWTVTSDEIQRRKGRIYALAQCKCGKEGWKFLENLQRGLSAQCKSCSLRKFPEMTPDERKLFRRCESASYRCGNPADKAYRDYGARGIQFLFKSPRDMLKHLLELAPVQEWGPKEIDRINNDGHYERGNIRPATATENNLNRRSTRWVTYQRQQVCQNHLWHLIKTDHPCFDFGPAKVRVLLQEGWAPDQIHTYQRKGLRRSTTCITPDPAIVSLYREG